MANKSKEQIASKMQIGEVKKRLNMMKLDAEYYETVYKINYFREKVGEQKMIMWDKIKHFVDKTIQYLDAGVRREEVYEKIGIPKELLKNEETEVIKEGEVKSENPVVATGE